MKYTEENNNARMGLRDGLPIGLGYLSVSFAFGIFATGSGLTVWEAVMISLFNLTSAGQLAAVPIMVGGGSLIELAASQLVINLRYSLMSITLSQHLSPRVRLRDRFAIAFGNTDEIFAVACSKEQPIGTRYYLALCLFPICGWVLGTLCGAIAGSLLPTLVLTALEIAIYAMFIAIVVPAAKRSRPILLCLLLAALLSCLFYYIPALRQIPSGFTVILCALAAALTAALLFPVADESATDDTVAPEDNTDDGAAPTEGGRTV